VGNFDVDGHIILRNLEGKAELYSSGSQEGFCEHANEI